MPIRRVGKEVDTAQYWAERGKAYESQIDGPYHSQRLAMIKRLLKGIDFKGKVCLDVGCGEGVILAYLAGFGASVIGFDLNEELVRSARKRLEQAGLQGRVFTSGIEAISKIEAESVDCLLALNVLAYFTDEEQPFFYKGASRIVRGGGAMIITHSNELFDMYTLNAFTVEFFRLHFGGSESADRIATLLTHPDIPEKISFNVRENPLTYRYKLAEYGFEETQQEFANLHPLPPLLMDPEGFVDIDKREYRNTLGWDEKDRWKLMFMCSMFGSRSVRK